MADFSDLKGKVLTKIEDIGDDIVFETACGKKYRMNHSQDCCEHVSIESITGDLNDLLGSEILLAEEVCNDDPDDSDACWTFYKLATIKGFVDIRWYGSSNGYYSIGVDFYEVRSIKKSHSL